jgi:hypothetical protein
MALADFQIETVELETIYYIGQKKGIEKSEIDELILHPDKVRFILPETLEEKIIYLYDFAKIIIADGIVDKNEIKSLELFCNRFGFKEINAPAITEFLINSAKENKDTDELLLIIKENLN